MIKNKKKGTAGLPGVPGPDRMDFVLFLLRGAQCRGQRAVYLPFFMADGISLASLFFFFPPLLIGKNGHPSQSLIKPNHLGISRSLVIVNPPHTEIRKAVIPYSILCRYAQSP